MLSQGSGSGSGRKLEASPGYITRLYITRKNAKKRNGHSPQQVWRSPNKHEAGGSAPAAHKTSTVVILTLDKRGRSSQQFRVFLGLSYGEALVRAEGRGGKEVCCGQSGVSEGDTLWKHSAVRGLFWSIK